jgi:hypothetical protein
MKKYRNVEYLNGFTNSKIPKVSKGFLLEVGNQQITIWHQSFIYSRHKEIIPFEQLVDVRSSVTQTRKTLSAGKAVVGTILLPGVGTLIGAAMGGKRKDYSLIISHIVDNRRVDLELITKQCSQIEQVIFDTMKKNGLKLTTESSGEKLNMTYLEEIEKLAELRDKSIITEQEFQSQKAHILGSL